MDLFDIWPWLGRRLRDVIRLALVGAFIVAPSATTAFIGYEAARHARHVERQVEAVVTPVLNDYIRDVQAQMRRAATVLSRHSKER